MSEVTLDEIIRWIAQARPEWMRDAACREIEDAEIFFPVRGESTEPAKTVCRACLVSAECAAFAIEHNEVGIWGGLSGRERRRLKPSKSEALDEAS